MKKMLIVTGGTGGHIIPAFVLSEECKKNGISFKVVGGGIKEGIYQKKFSFCYEKIDSPSFSGKNFLKIFRDLYGLFCSVRKSITMMKSFLPDVVVGFGSYYSFPMLIAALWCRIPIMLYEANRIPGKVNRLFARFCYCILTSFPGGVSIPGRKVEVNYPLRWKLAGKKKVENKDMTKRSCRLFFTLSPSKLTVLVFGGSQGARSLNEIFKGAMTSRIGQDIQVIHLVGIYENVAAYKNIYRKMGIHSYVASYEKEMEYAWRASDLVICRAGAGTIAEQLEFEVPGIYIPFPYAKDDHQQKNAEYIASEIGAAITLKESQIDATILREALMNLIKDEKRRGQMIEAMHRYKMQKKENSLINVIQKEFNKV